jgi:hypothetical protein
MMLCRPKWGLIKLTQDPALDRCGRLLIRAGHLPVGDGGADPVNQIHPLQTGAG